MSDIPISVEIRHGNVIFKCAFDGEWHNATKETAYSIQIVAGTTKTPTGAFGLIFDTIIICALCWDANKDKGLMFKEPSKIALPQPNMEKALKDLRGKN